MDVGWCTSSYVETYAQRVVAFLEREDVRIRGIGLLYHLFHAVIDIVEGELRFFEELIEEILPMCDEVVRSVESSEEGIVHEVNDLVC